MSTNRPTFHESWYRVRELRPQLRSTVQTYRQFYRGRQWHVVQDPSNNQHFRLDDAGYAFLALLDGERTVEQVWRICNENLGDRAPTQGEVINLLGQLYTSNLLRSDLPADAAGMFENYRRRVRREVGGYFMNLLFMRIPIFDPDHILDRWVRIAGPLFSKWALLAWGLLLLIAITQLAGREAELFSGMSGVLSPENLFLLYVSFAVLKAIHEFGHGFACKRFGHINGQGGEVHTMGIMLLVFTPVPYVDASSSWSFRSRWQRAAVGAAGMYVELACAAVAAIVWANTSPGVVNSLAYNTIFVASVSTLLFNGNPLLRFDGYYVLSDLLEIPNLARRSKDHFYYLVKRYVYGVRRATTPVRSAGEQFWLPVYFVASTFYRIIIFTGIILFVADKFFFIGAAFAIVSIVSWLFIPTGKFIRYLATSPDLARVRPRAQITSGMFFLALFLLIGAIPFPDRDRAEGVIEPQELSFVFVREDGFLRDFLPPGDRVTVDGGPLVVAENLELETMLVRLEAEHQLTTIQRNQAAVEEVAVAQSLTERLAALEDQITQVRARLDSLSPTPPVSGTWIAPGIDRVIGVYGRRGDPVGMIASLDQLLVRAIADQGLGPRIEPEIGVGGEVEIRVKGRPDLEFRGTIAEVFPAGFRQLPSAALGYMGGGQTEVTMDDESGTRAREPFFEVRIDIRDETLENISLWSGQRVMVRFTMPSRPLAAQWYHALRQLIQRRFQI